MANTKTFICECRISISQSVARGATRSRKLKTVTRCASRCRVLQFSPLISFFFRDFFHRICNRSRAASKRECATSRSFSDGRPRLSKVILLLILFFLVSLRDNLINSASRYIDSRFHRDDLRPLARSRHNINDESFALSSLTTMRCYSMTANCLSCARACVSPW